MTDITFLRLAGFITGVSFLFYILWTGKKGKIRGVDQMLGILAAASLMILSAYPQTISVVRDILALKKDQFSRIIAISILSNIALWVLIMSTRVYNFKYALKFDKLVRNLALAEFRHAYPELKKLSPVVVVIPAYNEDKNISGVLEKMPENIDNKPLNVLVIDDGSEDQTSEKAKNSGAYTVKSLLNRGGGAALRIGFDIATSYGAEIAVTMDADGQHLPQEIEKLVRPVIDDRADFVIGSRLLGQREKDSTVRYVGIHFFNWVIRLLTPVKITDCSNGYRALRLKSLSSLVLQQDQYHTAELIIEAARKGVRINEAPITVLRRLSGKSKKGKNWYYAIYFARTIFKTWWR